MERLDGTILRRDLPDGPDAWTRRRPGRCAPTSSTCSSTCTRSTRRRPGWTTSAAGPATSRRQVGGWSDRFRKARTDNVGDYERVMGWLDEQQPDDVATTRDPQRLPARQRGARPRRPAARHRRARLGDGHPRRPADGPLGRAGLLDPGRRRRRLPGRPATAVAPAGDADPGRDGRLLHLADGAVRHARAVAVLRGLRAVPARRDRAADLLPLPPRADHQRGLRPLPADDAVPRAALQPRSSTRPLREPAAARAARTGLLGLRRLRPAVARWARSSPGCSARRWPRAAYVPMSCCAARCSGTGRPPTPPCPGPAGTLRSSRRTPAGTSSTTSAPSTARRPSSTSTASPTRTGSAGSTARIARWASGEHDAEYVESFPAFQDRVRAALDAAVDRLEPRADRRRVHVRRPGVVGGRHPDRRRPARLGAAVEGGGELLGDQGAHRPRRHQPDHASTTTATSRAATPPCSPTAAKDPHAPRPS